MDKDFVYNAVIFKYAIDPEIAPDSKDEQYRRDLDAAVSLEKEMSKAEEDLADHLKKYPGDSGNHIKGRIAARKREQQEVWQRLMQVCDFDTKIKLLSKKPELKRAAGELRSAMKVLTPEISFCRLDISNFDFSKYSKKNFLECVQKGDLYAREQVHKLLAGKMSESDIDVMLDDFAGKKRELTEEEKQEIFSSLSFYVKGLKQEDVDFSKYNPLFYKDSSFSKQLSSLTPESVQTFKNLLGIPASTNPEEYISNLDNLDYQARRLEREKNAAEEELDRLPDGVGYYDAEIKIVSEKFNDLCKQYRSKTEQFENSKKPLDEIRKISAFAPNSR